MLKLIDAAVVSLAALIIAIPALAQDPSPDEPAPAQMATAVGPPLAAQAVYPGCVVPPTVAKNYFWMDATNGDDVKGDGSSLKPWRSIGALFNKVSGNPNAPLLSTVRAGAPVNPGDAVLLKTGNYGDVTLGNSVGGVDNSDWVTLTADIGASPVIHSIFIANTTKWALSNIEVQSLNVGTWPAMIEIVSKYNGGGPTHDIALTNMLIHSAPLEVWKAWTTPAAWQTNSRGGYSTGRINWYDTDTFCFAVTNSHISAVSQGAVLGAQKTLFQGNEIDHFNADGSDYLSSNVTIVGNRIHDVIANAYGNHMDAMQGQAGRVPPGQTVNKFSNVVIDGNYIQALVDPWIKSNNLLTYLQGIDAFDGDWSNVRVTNNVVITHSCYAVDLGSMHDSVVANNTGAWDGIPVTGCYPHIGAGGNTHQGLPASGITMINNIAPSIAMITSTPNSTYKNNVCTAIPGGYCSTMYYYLNGDPSKPVWQSRPGLYDGNLIDDSSKPGGGFGEFSAYDINGQVYDLRLAKGAQATSFGTANGAPSTTIGGGSRGVNPGAY